MKIFADLHIHSPYSRAVSKDMCFKNLERFGTLKGLNVLGTGDLTHPKWREEIRQLEEEDGLFRIKDGKVRFLLSGEVNTVFEVAGRSRRIHHLILLPYIEAADLLCEILSKRGRLEGDGRPTLSMTGAELVEETMEFGDDCMVIPAHIWTPWFSLFGAKGGVDRIEECYEDQTSHIYAAETGLSSDPPMNWRVSALDRFTLVSNSDSHSPLKIGREANIIEVDHLSYKEIVNSIMYHKDRVMTIEVDPAYGKYHWTGHRGCGVALPPSEAIRLQGICPVCGKPLTKGVAERIEELADKDRPEGFVPNGAQKFIRILPLVEVIGLALEKNAYSAEVQRVYWGMLKAVGSEMDILLNSPAERLDEAGGNLKTISSLIMKNREGRLCVDPGYDGVYGKLVRDELCNR